MKMPADCERINSRLGFKDEARCQAYSVLQGYSNHMCLCRILFQSTLSFHFHPDDRNYLSRPSAQQPNMFSFHKIKNYTTWILTKELHFSARLGKKIQLGFCVVWATLITENTAGFAPRDNISGKLFPKCVTDVCQQNNLHSASPARSYAKCCLTVLRRSTGFVQWPITIWRRIYWISFPVASVGTVACGW